MDGRSSEVVMPVIGRLVGGVRGLLKKRQVEQELDEELRGYFETAVEQNMSAGMNRDEAVRAARVEIGSLEATKDGVRDVGWETVVDSLWQDLRYAIRGLRASPGFTAVAVLTLAFGIGANTAIFSVFNSVLLRALPVVQPQRLVTVSQDLPGVQGFFPWTYAVWEQIRQRSPLFDGTLAWSAQRFNLAERGETQMVDGLFASGDFFSTLGVPALLGRTFTADDDVRGGGRDGAVAVISYALWQRQFGGAAGIIGMPVVVEGIPFTIVGVTPPDFFGAEVGRTFDVAVPIGTEPLIRGTGTSLDERRRYWLTVMLRLKDGQSIETAASTLRGVQPQIRDGALPLEAPLRAQQQFLTAPFTLVAAAAGTSSLRERYQRPLVTILAVVAGVLLIACANLANLLLTRATARRHELSVRLALGAPRWRLAGQLLVESLVLAGIGSVLGLWLAVWGGRALVAQLSTANNRVYLDLSLDWRVMAFTAAVAVATAVLFGTAPAFRATRAAPIDALKDRSRLGESGRASLSAHLVVAQVALSLVLVVFAGLFVRTFVRLASVPLGFDRDRVLLVDVNATRAGVEPAARIAFYHRLVQAVAAAPGVEHAAGSRVTPVSGQSTNYPVEVAGAPAMSERERMVRVHNVTPGWFATYGTRVRGGRDIDVRDTQGAPRIVLVNDAFVRKFLPGQNPLGRTLTEPASRGDTPPPPRTIVGVVGDAVYRSLRDEAPPTIYLPLAQLDAPGIPSTSVNISVRSSAGPPVALARSVAAALTAVDSGLAFTFRPLDEQIDASLIQERLVAMLSGFFGALALVLAGLGLYGVTSYAVTRRRNEIGIRMALGAQRSDVVTLVLRRSLVVTAIGITAGLAGAAAVTRYLQGMLFGLTPLDPATFVGVALLLAAVAAVAAYVPARRAAGVDPNVALRCE
jgi:putative ABC transport system permease protein